MEDLWRDYAKKELSVSQAFEETHPEVVPRTKLEEVWAWEDWAIEHFVRKLEVVA